jgi:hypothetical protein
MHSVGLKNSECSSGLLRSRLSLFMTMAASFVSCLVCHVGGGIAASPVMDTRVCFMIAQAYGAMSSSTASTSTTCSMFRSCFTTRRTTVVAEYSADCVLCLVCYDGGALGQAFNRLRDVS